jgi:hypothetical protein
MAANQRPRNQCKDAKTQRRKEETRSLSFARDRAPSRGCFAQNILPLPIDWTDFLKDLASLRLGDFALASESDLSLREWH